MSAMSLGFHYILVLDPGLALNTTICYVHIRVRGGACSYLMSVVPGS